MKIDWDTVIVAAMIIGLLYWVFTRRKKTEAEIEFEKGDGRY